MTEEWRQSGVMCRTEKTTTTSRALLPTFIVPSDPEANRSISHRSVGYSENGRKGKKKRIRCACCVAENGEKKKKKKRGKGTALVRSRNVRTPQGFCANTPLPRPHTNHHQGQLKYSSVIIGVSRCHLIVVLSSCIAVVRCNTSSQLLCVPS